MGQIKYTFEAIANRPKEQLDVLAKTHAIKYDFSDAFGIDTKPKKTKSNIDAYYDALTKLEYNGPNGLTARTNNPVATLYTQELADKFGAKKGPSLPAGDNPENRPLYTATFPDLETGIAAGKFIVSNVYNNAGGDIEKFASIYSMGKLPSQLIDSNEIAVKDRYVKALMSSTSKDDLAVTLKRQEDDVSQAVINETERLKTGDDLFRDSSDISRIFDPTTRMLKNEPADITAFSQASTTRTGAEDVNSLIQFEESKVPITPIGEGIDYGKGFTQLEEEAVQANTRISMSSAPDAPTGVDAWKTYWSNTFGANPDDDTAKALAVNILSNAGEIAVGFSDLKDKAITSLLTGEGGLAFAEEFIAGFAATPEILGNVIVASGINPLPAYNKTTQEGEARVLEAQKEVFKSPLLPMLAAVGLKAVGTGAIKAPAAVKKLAKTAKTQISELNAMSESALKIARGEANKADYSLAVNRLAEAIKDPVVFESTLKVIKKGKPYKRGVKVGYSPKQIKEALTEINTLAGTFFETTNSLQNPYVLKSLTNSQRRGLQNSAYQLKINILKQARIAGDDATITQLQGGFGLFKPDAKLLLEYLKGIKKELPDYINKKIISFQKTPEYINPNKKTSKDLDNAINLLKKTDDENKTNAEMNKPSWKDNLGKIAKATYDVGAEVNFAIDKAIKSVGGEESALLRQVRITKDLLNGTSGKAAFKVQQVNSTIYDKLSRADQKKLNGYINMRRENSLKKYHDKILPELENKLKTETKKLEIKKIQDEIKRIKNYKYSGDKKKGEVWVDGKIATESVRGSSPWLKDNAIDEFLANNSDISSKLVNAADDYFNVYRSLVDDMENSGLITPDEAIRYKMRDYSPKEYLEFMQGQKTYDVSGKKITVTDRGIKKLKEGDEGVLYNNSQQLLYDTINSVENKIANNNANNMLANVLKNGEIEGIGYLLKSANTKTKPGYVRVEYFKDGSKQAVALDDNFASGWIKTDGWGNQKALTVAQWALGTKVLKASATGYNPAFALINIPRDMAYVTLTQHGLYSNHIPIAYGQLIGDMVKVSKDAWKGTGRKLDYIEEGGSMQMLTGMGRLGDPFKPSNSKLKSGVKFAEALAGKIGEFSEIVTRLAVRERALKNGLSAKEATWTARNYLDFSKQGQITKFAETFIPYSGATVQATRGLFRSMGKPAFYYKAGQLALLQHMLRNHINNSEERKEVYGRIPDYVKYKNFVMPLPFTVTDKTGRKRNPYIKFPKDGGQSLVTGLYDASYNILTKERTSDYNLSQLEETVSSLKPYEISGLAPTINVAISWAQNRKFPYNSKVYKGDDRVTEGRIMTNLDEELVWKDLGSTLNISPAKLQYTADKFIASGNTFADVGYGSYDYIRKEMSEEQLDEYDRNFEKYIDMPMSDIPGIRQIPKRFLGFAEDVDIALKEEQREQESDKVNIIESNNQEIDSYLLNRNSLKSEKDKERALKEMNDWINQIEESNPEEADRLEDRYNKRKDMSNLDLARGIFKLSANKAPARRAFAIAWEMIKHKDDESTQKALIEELEKISPIVKGKRTGFLNEETVLYYDTIMESFNKDKILRKPIFMNPDKSKATDKERVSRAREIRKGLIRPNYNKEGKRVGESSHKMRAEIIDGRWVSFPTLFPLDDKGEEWEEYSKVDEINIAYRKAEERGELFEFGQDEKEAKKFAKGSWKLSKTRR